MSKSPNTDDTNPANGSPLTPRQFEAIAPAQVPLTATLHKYGMADSQPNVWQQYRVLIIGLPIALALLLVVVFILPANISRPSVAPTANEAATTESNNTAAAQAPTESPWTDAQFAKERRETQDILAKLLDAQGKLEGIQVQTWGKESFAAAAAKAASADQLYRNQEFQQAKSLYTEALAQFKQLLDRSERVFSDSLAQGLSAIEAGDAPNALQQYQLAAAIHPESAQAQTGVQRAGVLDKVLDLIKQGDRHQRQNDLEAAKQSYTEARQLDSQSTIATEKLTAINRAILDRDYAKAMSMGFAALNSAQYDQAINAFKQALRLKPGAGDAQAALVQAQNQDTQAAIQQLLTAAIAAEQAEQWQTALDNYNQALELDSNLVQARVGKIQAETRADIDRRLEDVLAQPDRLTTANVFSEYQQLGREIRQMQDIGPHLQDQFKRLEQAMRRAITPITVQLQSDNLTHVTVYKVGELGMFVEHQITVKPGQYTAVGTRPGYRDVRQEFSVSVNTEVNEPVIVQCVEKIPNG